VLWIPAFRVAVVVALHKDGGVVVMLPHLGKIMCENIGFVFSMEDSDLLPGGGVQDDGGVGVRSGAALGGVCRYQVLPAFFRVGINGKAGDPQFIVQRQPAPTAGRQPYSGKALSAVCSC